jgi:hypothetical protein
MGKRKKQLFEHDRKMELRLRLAAKKLGRSGQPRVPAFPYGTPFEREVLDRLIARVRSL